jgi:Tol biopolymer transport system component
VEKEVIQVNNTRAYRIPEFYDDKTIVFRFDAQYRVRLTGDTADVTSRKLSYEEAYRDQGIRSPDGKMLVRDDYVGTNERDEVIYEVFTSAADGSNRIQITHNRRCNRPRAFSPDGRRILFLSGSPRDWGGLSLWEVGVDGSDLRPLDLSGLNSLK